MPRNVTVVSTWLDHGNGVSRFYEVHLNGQPKYDVGFWNQQDAEIYAHGLRTFEGKVNDDE